MIRRKLFSSRVSGLTIVEIMVVLAIFAIAMVGVSTLMGRSVQNTGASGKKLAFTSLIGQIQQFANDNTSCTTVYAGTSPAAGATTITYNGQTFAAGSLYQNSNNQIQILQLQWGTIVPLSPTEQVGYLTLQVDLSAGSNQVIEGGNTLTFPLTGSNPPGIMVHMNLDPVTHLVSACGPISVNTTQTYYFSFPITTTSISDKTSVSGAALLPTPGFPDANYQLTCSFINSAFGAAGKFFGQLYIVNQWNTGFNWHFEQEIGDYQAVGTTFYADCVAFHK